jgi:hypothetical protein
MNGLDNHNFAANIRGLRRDLANLKEMVRLGARIPGDEQTIAAIKGLLDRGQEFASAAIGDTTAASKLGMAAGAAGGAAAIHAIQGPAR